MAVISAALVKQLREQTGAGMMDCKAALKESDGDIQKSQDWLRAKGLAKATKKSGRTTADGLIALAVKGNAAALIEVNTETDFVARNEDFQSAVKEISSIAVECGNSLDSVLSATASDGEGSVSDMITRMVSSIGENMQLRRIARIEVNNGAVAGYIHAPVSEGLGRIGVIVGIEGSGEGLADTARKVAMHIAATSPASVRREDMDQEMVEREKKVLTEEAKESGRPEGVIEKMVEGRLQKFFREYVLMEQGFAMDPDKTVGVFIEENHPGATVSNFAMLRLGDGIEKETASFADEVAQVGGGS